VGGGAVWARGGAGGNFPPLPLPLEGARAGGVGAGRVRAGALNGAGPRSLLVELWHLACGGSVGEGGAWGSLSAAASPP